MSLLGNILWFIFGGFFSGLSWVLSGVIWCNTATELAIKYAKREQLRIIIDKAQNIHADCEYEALSKLINELKQMLEEA